MLALLSDKGVNGITSWTRECAADIQELRLDRVETLDLVTSALRTGTYIASEWCQRHGDGPWAACDAYRFHRQERLPNTTTVTSCEYYVKLAIGKTGIMLLLISLHPSH